MLGSQAVAIRVVVLILFLTSNFLGEATRSVINLYGPCGTYQFHPGHIILHIMDCGFSPRWTTWGDHLESVRPHLIPVYLKRKKKKMRTSLTKRLPPVRSKPRTYRHDDMLRFPQPQQLSVLRFPLLLKSLLSLYFAYPPSVSYQISSYRFGFVDVMCGSQENNKRCTER